jgi:hypothetical protein
MSSPVLICWTARSHGRPMNAVSFMLTPQSYTGAPRHLFYLDTTWSDFSQKPM